MNAKQKSYTERVKGVLARMGDVALAGEVVTALERLETMVADGMFADAAMWAEVEEDLRENFRLTAQDYPAWREVCLDAAENWEFLDLVAMSEVWRVLGKGSPPLAMLGQRAETLLQGIWAVERGPEVELVAATL